MTLTGHIKRFWIILSAFICCAWSYTVSMGEGYAMAGFSSKKVLKLPEINISDMPLEQALLERRSIRKFNKEPLTLNHISQLLWASQGVTHPRGYRTAPSAGALYPLEVYLVAGKVSAIDPGVYRYVPDKHELIQTIKGDYREKLSASCLRQNAILDAPAVFVFSGVYKRTSRKYGDRGLRYVFMEAGHAAQNVCLQAIPIGLGSVVIGAFSDASIKTTLKLPVDESPLYVIPVGFEDK
jgi:SagB-type dehydrogenase family enzyme